MAWNNNPLTNPNRFKDMEEEKRRKKAEQEADEKRRVAEGGKLESQYMQEDLRKGADFAKEQGFDQLGRSTDFADVRKSRDILDTRATEGLSDAEEGAIREKGMRQLQGSEQSQRRKLLSTQAASGVRGGAAGQMQVELAAQAMNNRRALETDLILQDEQTKRAGELQFANFATKQAEFDLAQAAKEKLALAQSSLAFAELGSNARSQIRQNIATEKAAGAKKRGGGTVMCTAMHYHGFISDGVWRSDVKAGMRFLKDPTTRDAFRMYQKVCGPLAEYCKKNKWAAILVSPIIVPISKHFSDGNLLGEIFFNIGKKIFTWMARNEG